MNNENAPSLASLLKQGCQVTHFRNSRGWIETPDGRHFKPEPNKVRFVHGMNRPFVYTPKINKSVAAVIARALKKLF
ncbi:MAG: phage filamentation protein Fil family protein [Pluralibacter gergoviae]|nr:phage filamentation protein Fil family protein [Pluralibacter gergoviae]